MSELQFTPNLILFPRTAPLAVQGLLVLLSNGVAALSVLGGSWRLGSDWLGANPVTKSIPSPASGLLTGRGRLQRHLWDRL